MKIIYDIGANTGDDIAYYLKKSDKVVAIEANPDLARLIEQKFKNEIASGRLIIENYVVTAQEYAQPVPFYIHQAKGYGCSTFIKPPEEHASSYKKVILPHKTLKSIIDSHGLPYYVKIDVEGYDADLLKALFSLGVFPPFISVESHNIDIFALLAGSGNYTAFKLVDGDSLSELYGNCNIRSRDGEEQFSFQRGMAGPFGEDILGGWLTANNFFRKLAFEGLGWKDIHATNLHSGDDSIRPKIWSYIRPYLIKKITPKPIRPILLKFGIKSNL